MRGRTSSDHLLVGGPPGRTSSDITNAAAVPVSGRRLARRRMAAKGKRKFIKGSFYNSLKNICLGSREREEKIYEKKFLKFSEEKNPGLVPEN